MAVTSCVALLVNPYGWRAVLAPLQLMALIRQNEFVNVEWLPSSPLLFPLLYVAVGGGAVLFFVAPDRRSHVGHALLFAALAWLAIRHVRHQGLFYAALPLLTLPLVDRSRISRKVALLASALIVLAIAATTPHGAGPSQGRFPLAAVARLQAAGLKGNVYNPDQFGGFLIWRFYPERRALTDGRNELHHTYIRRFARARLDEREWRALLRDYRIDLAVDEYRPALEVRDAGGDRVRRVPASVAYWPRRDWALIAYDDVSMVFARRAAFPAAVVARWELPGIVPDAR
jgi:hypothetical protein